MKSNHLSHVSRRQFLRKGVATVGAAGMGGLAAALAQRSAHGAQPRQSNPFAYDISRLSKTDPSLIHYQELKRFKCPHPSPRRLLIGPDQRLYVAARNYVSILDLDGQPLSEKALTNQARCVTVAEDGTLYVSLRDHIEMFAPESQQSKAWESPGNRTWISGLAAGKNDVFAADAGNRVIHRFDRSGKLLGQIGKRDRERNIPGLIMPSPFLEVEIHPDGLLRVNNPGRHRVEAYTFDGHLELAWGKPSAAIEGFCGCCNPIALATFADGRILTCEKGIPRVKIYSVHGEMESVVAGAESFPENAKAGSAEDPSDGTHAALDAVVDGKGRVYILDTVTAEVRIMEKKKSSAILNRPSDRPPC